MDGKWLPLPSCWGDNIALSWGTEEERNCCLGMKIYLVAIACVATAGALLEPLSLTAQQLLNSKLAYSEANADYLSGYFTEDWEWIIERLYSDTPFTADSDLAKYAVERHNFFRVQGAGLPPVVWNQTIADDVWDYVYRDSVLEHGDCTNEHKVGGRWGENIYQRCYYPYLPEGKPAPLTKLHVENAVNSWFNEISRYQYKAGKQYNYCPQRGSAGTTLHFRQVMWDEAVQIGCAIKDCVKQRGSGDDYCVSVFCNYFEWGGAGRDNRQPFGPESVEKLKNFPYVKNNIPGGLPEC